MRHNDNGSLPNIQALAGLLGGEVNGGQILAPGPGHSAADRSLSVKLDSDAPDGFVTHSFANDDHITCRDYVREKAGLEPFKPNGGNGHRRFMSSEEVIAKVMRVALNDEPTISSKPKGRLVATHDYVDANGALLFQVLRYGEPKDFRQRRPDGNGGFIWSLGDVRRVLYRLPELLKYPDATVFVCEGEKDADRVASLNHCATTAAYGDWKKTCVKALAGHDVIILQDKDAKRGGEPGRSKALTAAQALHGVAKSIRIALLPDLDFDINDVSDWLDAGPGRADKLVDICFRAPVWTPTTAGTSPTVNNSSRSPWKYHTGKAPAPARWCIKGILPETGAAIMSGQWGTFKTSVALDMSASVMAELPFADRYRVKRRGAVLYLALEGEHMLSARLSAMAEHRGITAPLPFAWRGDCPALTSKNAAIELCAIADEAAANLKRDFDLPVALIWVDTMITAAGYEDGGDNDTSAAQKVMSVLRILSQHTGALVIGIDHFGKVVETGTRGSSAKEGAADAVIALLADRELGGSVKNTRLALRKVRDGVSGLEMPFTAQTIQTGSDDDGDPITAIVIDWQATLETTPSDIGWTPSLQLLRRILMTILADTGKDVWPFLDSPKCPSGEFLNQVNQL